VALSRFDSCNNLLLISALGSTNALDLQVPNDLSSATLSTTMNLDEFLSGGTIVVTVEMTWTATGPRVTQNSHSNEKEPGFHSVINFKGDTRDGTATGTISDGSEQFIPLPSTAASLNFSQENFADITMSSGAYVALTANDGILDRDADVVTLSGDVTLFHDNGLSFQTDSATIDLNAKTAEGNDVVEGQNGDGELVSQGFRVLDDGDTIEFTGKAYMKIYPKQKDQGG